MKEVTTHTGSADFYYLKPADYYLRVVLDENGNGKWDTGNYKDDVQPEMVYYYQKEIACKAKWDVTLNWNPLARKLNEQKPAKLLKQKAEPAKRQKVGRNLQRAKDMGIPYPGNK